MIIMKLKIIDGKVGCEFEEYEPSNLDRQIASELSMACQTTLLSLFGGGLYIGSILDIDNNIIPNVKENDSDLFNK